MPLLPTVVRYVIFCSEVRSQSIYTQVKNIHAHKLSPLIQRYLYECDSIKHCVSGIGHHTKPAKANNVFSESVVAFVDLI